MRNIKAVSSKGLSSYGTAVAVILTLMFASQAASAIDLLAPFKGIKNLFKGDDEIVIWEDDGQYIKVVEQDWDRDHRTAEPNGHPAQVDPQQLAITLASLQGWLPEQSPETASSVPLFTEAEIALLAPRIADAMSNIGPRQDIVFATAGIHAGVPGSSRRMSAGRMFMLDNRLNFIFGDILRPVEPGDLDNISIYEKPHRAGKRMEPLGRDIVVNNGIGISHFVPVERLRLDWVVVDIPEVVAAYGGPQVVVPVTATAALPANVENIENLTSEESRRMREELARMRKQSAQVESSAVAPVPSATQVGGRVSGVVQPQQVPGTSPDTTQGSIQQRLQLLKELYDQDLITEEEYNRKRGEILDQI